MNDLRYTLIFLTRGDEILMLHRRKPPNQDLWNGIGGHIEAGEEAEPSALREIREETGYRLQALRFGGILTWEGFETPPGGLYIFTAPAPVDLGEPRENGEGVLAWKPRNWVLSSEEVVSNIHVFGPHVLAGEPPQRYHFVYRGGQILDYRFTGLDERYG